MQQYMRYQQAVGASHLPFAKGAMLTGVHFRREGHDLGTYGLPHP